MHNPESKAEAKKYVRLDDFIIQNLKAGTCVPGENNEGSVTFTLRSSSGMVIFILMKRPGSRELVVHRRVNESEPYVVIPISEFGFWRSLRIQWHYEIHVAEYKRQQKIEREKPENSLKYIDIAQFL